MHVIPNRRVNIRRKSDPDSFNATVSLYTVVSDVAVQLEFKRRASFSADGERQSVDGTGRADAWVDILDGDVIEVVTDVAADAAKKYRAEQVDEVWFFGRVVAKRFDVVRDQSLES